MNRQLLPRQRPQTPPRAPAAQEARRSARPPGDAAPPVGRGRVLRRPVVLALVAGASAALAVLAWVVLTSPSDATSSTASSVLVRPRPTHSPTSAQNSASPASSAPATDGAQLPLSGRDPFADEEPSVPTGRATPPHAEPSPTQTAASPTSASTPGGTSTSGAGSDATVTVTVAPTYVGLYAWNGDRASFRVNARTYSVEVGTRFGPGLRFTAVVPGTPRCAKVQHGEDTLTLCPGQFTALS